MTNKEAIEYNKNLREYMKITDKDSEYKFLQENYESLDMGNKALAYCEQRVGTWIINKEYNGYETIIKDCKCPFCDEKALLKKSYSMDGESVVLYPSNYCPSCGAKLEVAK